MGPRIVILLVVAVVLAILAGVKFTSPKTELAADEPEMLTTGNPDDTAITNQLLRDRPLAGEEPPVPPELSVQVEVNKSTGKNRLEYWITEGHGFYVESFAVRFFYKKHPDDTWEDSDLWFEHYVNKFIPAGEPLHDCIEVVSAELKRVGGDIGESENWGADIVYHGRWRAKNPDPLPLLSNVVDCQ